MLIMSVFRGDAGGKLDIGRAMSFVPQRPQAATTASPIEVRLKGVSRVKSSIVHLVGMPTGICTTSSTTLCANIDLEPLVKPCLQVHMPDCKHGGWSARLSHDWMLQGATHRLPLADTSSCHHSQLCMGMPWQSTRVEPEPSQCALVQQEFELQLSSQAPAAAPGAAPMPSSVEPPMLSGQPIKVSKPKLVLGDYPPSPDTVASKSVPGPDTAQEPVSGSWSLVDSFRYCAAFRPILKGYRVGAQSAAMLHCFHLACRRGPCACSCAPM